VLRLVDLRGATGPVVERLPRPAALEDPPMERVREIVEQVKRGGDRALLELTRRFDGVDLEHVMVEPEIVERAPSQVGGGLREALEAAASRVEAYQRHRAEAIGLGCDDVYEKGGVKVTTRRVPVESAGLYVPGGRARYPSTVVMTAIPARVAGVGRVVLCVPPGPDGNPPIETLAAAAICGVDSVYRIGGAQAVAAMAYGTESVERVDVIAGPGNLYVSLAQKEVAGSVGVPSSFAGPSEVVVVADASSDPKEVAVDLAVQAEHGPDGLAWLVTWEETLVDAVSSELAAVVDSSPRRDELAATLSKGGFAALVEGQDRAVEVVDAIAPEHLEVMTDDPWGFAEKVGNAGCVFLGGISPASVGDYVAGPSHVLPTNGTARFSGALSVVDFTRERSVVEVASSFYPAGAGLVTELAGWEGLPAHAMSVRSRTGGK